MNDNDDANDDNNDEDSDDANDDNNDDDCMTMITMMLMTLITMMLMAMITMTKYKKDARLKAALERTVTNMFVEEYKEPEDNLRVKITLLLYQMNNALADV